MSERNQSFSRENQTHFRFTGLFTWEKVWIPKTLILCYFIPENSWLLRRNKPKNWSKNSFPLGKVTLGGQDPWGSRLLWWWECCYRVQHTEVPNLLRSGLWYVLLGKKWFDSDDLLGTQILLRRTRVQSDFTQTIWAKIYSLGPLDMSPYFVCHGSL